jgi:hypothetical protein
LAAGAALFAGLAGCGGDTADRSEGAAATDAPVEEATARETNSIDGYSLPQDARSAIIFRLSTTGIRGRVVSVGEPEVVRPDAAAREGSGIVEGDTSLDRFVSVPVEVAVDDVLYGAVDPGATVTLRILGGETEEVATVAHAAEALPLLTEGAEIAFFSGDGVDYEDGRTMYTPDQIFVADGDSLTSAWGTEADATTWAEIDALVAERERLAAEAEAEAEAQAG